MGIFDVYGRRRIQIKVSNDGELGYGLRQFNLGDKVPLHDGVYIGLEGIVVVVDGTFVAEFDHVTDKWGNQVSYAEWLRHNNPVTEAIKEAMSKS